MKTIWTILAFALPLAFSDTVLAQKISTESLTYGDALQNADEGTTKALREIELKFEAILEIVGTLNPTITLDAERSMIKKAFNGIVKKSLAPSASATDISNEIPDEVELLKRELLVLKNENDELRSELLRHKSSTQTDATDSKKE